EVLVSPADRKAMDAEAKQALLKPVGKEHRSNGHGNGHGNGASQTAPTAGAAPTASRMAPGVEVAGARPTRPDAQLAKFPGDAPMCDICGHITLRSGTCYKCLNCGNSMGCS